MATREIVVNMVPGGVTPVIHVSQYDDGYGITANLIENSGTYTVPVGATVSIEGTKPDGHGYAYLCTYQDNAVVIPVNTQMTAVKGKHPCELVVRKEGLRVGSKNMIMAVEVAGLGEDTIISDTELPAIIALAQEQEEAAQEAAEDAAESAEQAAELAAQIESSRIVTDASGSIAAFSDGADDVAVKSLVASITPVQDLNGQANPYPAGGGVNKLSAPSQFTQTSNGVTLSSDGNGNYTLTGTATSAASFTFDIPAVVMPSTAYLHLLNPTAPTPSSALNIDFYNGSTRLEYVGFSVNRIYNATSTLGGQTVNKLGIRVASEQSFNNFKFSPMILETGATTPFTPYSNICLISGRTGLTVTAAGKNLLYTDVDQYSNNGITIVKNADGSYTLNGTATAQVDAYFDNVDVAVPNGEYLYNGITGGSPQTYRIYLSVRKGNSTRYIGTNDGDASVTLTDETVRAFVRIYNGAVLRNVVIKSMLRPATITDDTYEPYTAQTIPITWESIAGTVYGGTLDVVSGVLTVTDALIASYDGETLPSTWISDRDVYAAGTTPTTGAQVVYKLATPQTYQLTPTEVRTLLGGNTIYTDAGDVTVEYVADTKLYIDNKITELQALVLENN